MCAVILVQAYRHCNTGTQELERRNKVHVWEGASPGSSKGTSVFNLLFISPPSVVCFGMKKCSISCVSD